MDNLENILNYMPIKLKQYLKYKIEENLKYKNIEEIRLRINKQLCLKIGQELILEEYIISAQELLETFQKICENSVYTYTRQICDGFITIKGGNRVGIVGSAVLEKGQVINVNYISSLNFRVAREKIGCSDSIMPELIDFETSNIYNTLIISPPGGGKTTILRDIIRNISNGIEALNFKGKTCGIVDERGEIAAMYKGVPQNNVGMRTDVIDNIPKPDGIRILVRSMSPNVIACDEIGSKKDVQAIDYAMCSGVKGIFTAHGKNLEQIEQNEDLSILLRKGYFERLLLLGINHGRCEVCKL